MTVFGCTPYSGYSSEITKTFTTGGNVEVAKAVMLSNDNEVVLYDGSKLPVGIAIKADTAKTAVACVGKDMYIPFSGTIGLGEKLYLQDDGTFDTEPVVGKEGLSVVVTRTKKMANFFEGTQQVQKEGVAVDYDFIGGMK